MKKIFITVVAAMMATINVAAQGNVTPYFSVDEMPDLIKCLPPPPSFDNPEFANDMMRYSWGKQQRTDSVRAEIAKGDAIWSYEALFHQFAGAFGLEVTREGTPEIWNLLETALTTTDAMRVKPKAHYLRQRPFERFDDAMLTGEEDELRGEGSYPSGHTMRGWTCALLMAEIAPMRADTIFARGWMYGESRVIAGAHWQSDVDASRVAASIAYCALQGSDAFRRQMKRAQAEYLVKAGQSTDMQRATIIDKEKPSARSYRPDGVRSSDSSKGVTIERQHKVLRR